MIGVCCPGCGSAETGVLDSRAKPGGIRRRRRCEPCGRRFTTFEGVTPTFNRAKLAQAAKKAREAAAVLTALETDILEVDDVAA